MIRRQDHVTSNEYISISDIIKRAYISHVTILKDVFLLLEYLPSTQNLKRLVIILHFRTYAILGHLQINVRVTLSTNTHIVLYVVKES